MGNLPVVHEVTTSFQSLGDAITGDLDGAANRWNTYAEQSVIGSGVYAAVEAARGNEESHRIRKRNGKSYWICFTWRGAS